MVQYLFGQRRRKLCQMYNSLKHLLDLEDRKHIYMCTYISFKSLVSIHAKHNRTTDLTQNK